MLTKKPLQDLEDLYFEYEVEIVQVLGMTNIAEELTEMEALVIFMAAYTVYNKDELKITNLKTGKSKIVTLQDFKSDTFFFTADELLMLFEGLCQEEDYKTYGDLFELFESSGELSIEVLN